jgi:hypothetical protein
MRILTAWAHLDGRARRDGLGRIAMAWEPARRDHSEFRKKTNPPEVGVARLAD